MNFKEITPKKLYGNCHKRGQTFQSSKTLISQFTEFLGQIYSDLEELFPTRQSYRFYISFLEKSIGLINIKLFKYKDNTLAIFKNYKALCKKQFDYQLKVLPTNAKKKYIEEFDNYFKDNSITNNVTASYSFE